MNIETLKSYEPFFSDWYLDSKISEGKDSQLFKVYKSENERIDYLSLAVIKVQKSEYLSLKALQNKAEENLNIMLRFRNDKNVVRTDNFQIISDENCFYVLILTELLTPVTEYIKADKIELSQIVKIGRDICFALNNFRKEGFIHNMVKPENIFVDSLGNYKLGYLSLNDIKDERTPYSAPEILLNKKDVSSCDIYALGITLYKLLNNNRTPFLPPFPLPISITDREQAIEKCKNAQDIIKPTKADEELSEIVLKAVSFYPKDRYKSPLLMAAKLENYLSTLEETPFVPIESTSISLVRTPSFDLISNEDVEHIEESINSEITAPADKITENEKSSKIIYFAVLAFTVALCLIMALFIVNDKNENSKNNTTAYNYYSQMQEYSALEQPYN